MYKSYQTETNTVPQAVNFTMKTTLSKICARFSPTQRGEMSSIQAWDHLHKLPNSKTTISPVIHKKHVPRKLVLPDFWVGLLVKKVLEHIFWSQTARWLTY